MKKSEKIVFYYLKAKQLVVQSGFSSEVAWQEMQSLKLVTAQIFFAEYSWVVLSSGMRESVVRAKYQELMKLFNNWDPIKISLTRRERLRSQALKIFNHTGKIDAIISMAGFLKKNHFPEVRLQIEQNAITYLQNFAFIGPATSFHLAKNLGCNVAKPDRHLVRISEFFGYSCANKFCENVADLTGEKVNVIDIVLWRYATLNRNYLTMSFKA